jgi:hypothetical protein
MCVSNTTLASGDSRQLQETFASTIITKATRETFWEEASKCHVGVCGSEFENLGLGFLEQLALGVPVIIPRREWSALLYPDWYPWFYTTEVDAVNMLSTVKAQWRDGSVHALIKRVQEEWLYPMVGTQQAMSHLMQFVLPLVEGRPDKIDPTVRFKQYTPLSMEMQKLLARAVMRMRGHRAPLHTLMRLVAKLGESFPSDRFQRAIEPRLPSDYDVYRTLQEWGLIDDVKSAFTTFTVPADFAPPALKSKKKVKASPTRELPRETEISAGQ